MFEKILNARILITLNCMFLMGNKKSCAVCNGKGKIELLDSSCPFCNGTGEFTKIKSLS